jgi:hypothetical protein
MGDENTPIYSGELNRGESLEANLHYPATPREPLGATDGLTRIDIAHLGR